jgi:hypothetical protein
VSLARARVGALLCASLAALAWGCGGEAPPAKDGTTLVKDRPEPVRFAYRTLDDKPLTPATLAGRFTLIALGATYDLPSQAQARFLTGLSRNHTPRINVALLILEPEENRPLVEAFVQALRLEYPVAFADQSTITGKGGPFPGLHHIPSIVILDREGREVWRHLGLADDETLEKALRDLESSAAR